MLNEITTIDSSLTRPWTVTKRYGRDPKEELIWTEENCAEGNGHVEIRGQGYFLSAGRRPDAEPQGPGATGPSVFHRSAEVRLRRLTHASDYLNHGMKRGLVARAFSFARKLLAHAGNGLPLAVEVAHLGSRVTLARGGIFRHRSFDGGKIALRSMVRSARRAPLQGAHGCARHERNDVVCPRRHPGDRGLCDADPLRGGNLA
jgi:hypothetical protein